MYWENMKQININGLRISYKKDRDLFNALLKMNGVTKKKFCEKFDLSYSYVNAWGSTTKIKEIKYPSWVFIYLQDVMYYKIEAICIKMNIVKLYDELESGKNLTQIYKMLNKKNDVIDADVFIPDEIIEDGSDRFIEV
jgi:predicted AlkP superfamily pyrophosphatase or phosphodiesterase